MRVLSSTVAIAALALPAAAFADEAADADAGEPIVVVGQTQGYAAISSSSATRTDTPLIDVPQSVAVVTRQQLDDQAHHSMADVLRYVPGTTVGQGEGNRDQVTLRGQNTTASFFVDGVRDDVQYYRSLYNIQQVEVLKGPSALIFGRGGGGGVINRVLKQPTADAFAGAASASVNTFGNWDLTADVNAPLGGGAALRVNAFYENLASFRDHTGGERYAVNPSLVAPLGPNWQAGLSYEYVNDDRVVDRGVPSVACAQPCTPTPLTGHTDSFFGVPGINRTGFEAHVVRARLDGQLAEGLKWTNTLLLGDYDKFYTNAYASGAFNPATNRAPLGAYTDSTRRRNYVAQSNLVWNIGSGPITNKVLLGIEYARQNSASRHIDGVLSIASLDPDAPVYPQVAFMNLTRDTSSRVTVFSAYAQDQIGLGPKIDLLLGLRYDRFSIRGADVVAANAFDRTDEKVSPRVGLILKPRANLSLYGSYSQSFQPRSGDQFLTLTPVQENLAPERFTNWEAGAKWDVRPGLSATAAVFQLDRTNATTPDPANPLVTINVGSTRTRGAEVALTGQITPRWQVSGGYTWQHAVLKGNDAVRLGQVPESQLSLWNRYDVTRRLGLGVGVIHQSSQYAAIRTAPTVTLLPGFTRVDAALFVRPAERLQIQLNVENLFDTEYFSDAHNANNITPGAPRNVRVTARLKF